MKIRIVAVSKNKDAYIEAGEQEYRKRLQRYCDLEFVYIKEEPITASSVTETIREREGERILRQLDKQYVTVALDVLGKTMSSEKFSDYIEQVRDFKGGKLCFVIGGPLGLAPGVLAEVDLTLSLSAMTFTHQLIRLLLLEQIYRAFEIVKGSGYHK